VSSDADDEEEEESKDEDVGLLLEDGVVVARDEVSRIGLGSAKTPQFVRPRTTPPLRRTMLPAVFAILMIVSLVTGKRWSGLTL